MVKIILAFVFTFISFYGLSQAESEVLEILNSREIVDNLDKDSTKFEKFKRAYFLIKDIKKEKGTVSIAVLVKFIKAVEEELERINQKKITYEIWIIESSYRNMHLFDTYFILATEKITKSDYYGARQALEKCLYHCPEFEDKPVASHIYYYLGLLEVQIGKKKKACLLLSKAGELGEEQAYRAISDLCN